MQTCKLYGTIFRECAHGGLGAGLFVLAIFTLAYFIVMLLVH